MLEKFLCIRRDERKNILFFSLLGFAWSVSVSFGVAFSDVLFIESVGAQSLPLAFIITSLGFFAFSGIFIYLYNRKGIQQIYYLWTALSATFYALVFCALFCNVQSKAFFVAFKAFSYIIQIGFYSCFWTFIDQYFELQNAKRLFGIFYSAIFLGTAVAGAAMIFCSSPAKSASIVLTITAIPLICSAYIVKFIHHNLQKLPDDFEQFFVLKTSTRSLIKSIITSPFTILLLTFCILLQILLVITEYEYMFGLQTFFQHSPEGALTDFLGRLYFFGGVFNILFGIFLYGRLIKKAGLNNVLLLVPVFFTALYFGWSFSSHLMLTVMGFVAVEGVLTLVEDNNFTLLLNAVPLKLKGKIRIICESLIEPFGILISSILILVSQHHSKFLGLCISLFMLGVGLLMRAYYTKGVFYNLISHVINFQPTSHSWEAQISRKDYQKSKQKFLQQFLILKKNEQFFILECALRFNDKKFLRAVMGKITKLSSEIKRQVLHILSHHSSEISRELELYFHYWIKQDSNLYEHIIFHLSKMGLISSEKLTSLTSPYLRASNALVSSKEELLESSYKTLKEMLLSDSEEENQIAVEAIAFTQSSAFNNHLMELIEKKPFLKDSILETLSSTLKPTSAHLLPSLLSELEAETHIKNRYLLVSCIERTLSPHNLETVLLQTIHWSETEKRDLSQTILKMGFEAAPTLVSVLENTKYADKIRLFSGQILSKLDKKLLKASFQKICNEEIKRANLYYYHFINLQKSYPYSITHLLGQALKHSFDSILDFIIQIQAHLKNFEQGAILTQSLHSKNPKTYSQAQETLQKMCSRELYSKIQALIEPGHERDFFKNYHNQKLPTLSLDELLDLLEHSSSRVNRTIVFTLKDRLNIQDSISKEEKISPLKDEVSTL